MYCSFSQLKQMMIDLGGVLGLWLGLAVFTTCELLEFIVDVIALYVSVWIRGRRPVFTVAPLIKPKMYKTTSDNKR